MLSLTKKHLMIAGVSVLLTACGGSELDNKSAKTLYQEAVQHLYAKDSQYNFKGEALVDIGVENPFASGLMLKIAGAVDNKQLRYEVLPEIEAGMFNVKLPIKLDINKKELLVNPSSILDTVMMFAPQAAEEAHKYRNKFIRFSPDNFTISKEDMAEVSTVVSELTMIGTQALEQASKNIPEQSIRKLELDDKAKEIGAKVIVNVELDEAQSRALQQQVNQFFRDSVAANTKLPEDFKKAFLEGMDEAQDDAGYESSSSFLYINDKGQPIHERAVFNYGFDGDSVSVSLNMDYLSFGSAKFVINPAASDIVNFTEEDLRALQGEPELYQELEDDIEAEAGADDEM